MKLRHKKPTEDTSRLQEFILRGDASPWQQTDDDFRFAAGIALWGMGLRQIDDLDNQLDKARMIISESTKNNENREAFSKILSRQ